MKKYQIGKEWFDEEDIENLETENLDIIYARAVYDVTKAENYLKSRPKEGEVGCWSTEKYHDARNELSARREALELVTVYKLENKLGYLYILEDVVNSLDDATADDIWDKVDKILDGANK